ncbi:MAG: hypothetical protein ACYC9O_08770 [Candidatus Latescibacterota bacterium]
MAKQKCAHCGKNAAKRHCPPLDRTICPVCCGGNRLKTIDCDDECRYLDNEQYQEKVFAEKELNELLHTVPSGQFDDIFRDDDAAGIAYTFETLIADCYVKKLFHLNDVKVKNTLARLYFVTQRGKIEELDDFGKLLRHAYNQKLREGYDAEFIGKVMLRMIISIKRMTGGAMGPCSYLNYVKNNIHPDYAHFGGDTIVEDRSGMKITIPTPGSRSHN